MTLGPLRLPRASPVHCLRAGDDSAKPNPSIFCLQEDYVKWKGALFFRFLTALIDTDYDIRRFGTRVQQYWCSGKVVLRESVLTLAD